jgi:hypothetical protein
MPTSSGFAVGEVLSASNANTYFLRSGRNALMNGSMDIAQRAASTAGISVSGYFSVDRFSTQLSSIGTWTQSQQAVTNGESPAADGFRNSIRMLCTTANASPIAGAFCAITQQIEGQNLQQFAKGNASAKPFALSFWVRSNKVGTYICELYDNTNTRQVSASYTIASSGVWQKVRIIFPADTVGAFNSDINAGIQVNWWLGAGTTFTGGGSLQTTWATVTNGKRTYGQVNLADTVNNYWQMTGAQLEPNSICTPFENEDIQVVYAKCWRYFQRHYAPTLRGVVGAGSFQRMGFAHPPMRTAPSVSGNSGSAGFYDGVTAVIGGVGFTNLYSFGNSSVEVDIASAGWGTGRAACMYQFSGNTLFMDLTAEF